MGVSLLAGSLSLVLTEGTASAQSPNSAISSSETGAPKTPIEPKASNYNYKPGGVTPSDAQRTADSRAQCLKDWDAGTHLTKQEWGRICRRVVDDRAKFLGKEGMPIPGR
jgi:hypothetical protein